MSSNRNSVPSQEPSAASQALVELSILVSEDVEAEPNANDQKFNVPVDAPEVEDARPAKYTVFPTGAAEESASA